MNEIENFKLPSMKKNNGYLYDLAQSVQRAGRSCLDGKKEWFIARLDVIGKQKSEPSNP